MVIAPVVKKNTMVNHHNHILPGANGTASRSEGRSTAEESYKCNKGVHDIYLQKQRIMCDEGSDKGCCKKEKNSGRKYESHIKNK